MFICAILFSVLKRVLIVFRFSIYCTVLATNLKTSESARSNKPFARKCIRLKCARTAELEQ